MKLKQAQITNFRCIDDSTLFHLDDVTCLVGKNESGKTSVLQALERLNPYESSRQKYDKLKDYPRRHLSDYEVDHVDKDAQVLHTEWELEPNDIKALQAEFGAKCLDSNTLVVTKTYESEVGEWSLPLVNENEIIKHLLTKAGCFQEEVELYKESANSKELFKKLESIENPSKGIEKLKTILTGYRDNQISLRAIDILSPLMPKFLYFSNYDLMSGEVSVEHLKANKSAGTLSAGDKVFLAFLEFAGTTLEEISDVSKYEDLRARVEAASIKITKQVFEFWSQNRHLKVQFHIDAARPNDPSPLNIGTIMRARIYNQLHEMTVSFSDRSAGFIWFFSFLVLFSQVKKQHGNVIILLDEPGLNLHAKAQGDLLRYIDAKLRPEHQVVYTTHSPFMVPAENLMSVRTVEDVVIANNHFQFEALGTKVNNDALSTDKDTLFPLQGALGYEISQSLFVGANTLLVEGPSDVLYIQAASNALKSRGKTCLDARWTLCPSGGIDKISAFVSLFNGNQIHIAVLTDFAMGQKSKLERLRCSKLLKDGHIFSIADFCEKDEADTEDLFGDIIYIDIVNSAYNLGQCALSLEKVRNEDKDTLRIVPKIEKFFRTLPSDVPEFDHFTPSSWLIRNPQFLEASTNECIEALNRWETVFKTFNSLLEASAATSIPVLMKTR